MARATFARRQCRYCTVAYCQDKNSAALEGPRTFSISYTYLVPNGWGTYYVRSNKSPKIMPFVLLAEAELLAIGQRADELRFAIRRASFTVVSGTGKFTFPRTIRLLLPTTRQALLISDVAHLSRRSSPQTKNN